MRNQLYKYTCDRCGKEGFFDIVGRSSYSFVCFDREYNPIKGGHVCPECLKDFTELAQNFFDEVNRNEQREAD